MAIVVSRGLSKAGAKSNPWKRLQIPISQTGRDSAMPGVLLEIQFSDLLSQKNCVLVNLPGDSTKY